MHAQKSDSAALGLAANATSRLEIDVAAVANPLTLWTSHFW